MRFVSLRHLLFLVLPGLLQAAPEMIVAPKGGGIIQMASWPCLSPDGKIIAFEWRDDLWSAPADGGRATRITAHPARDSYPQFSPDGKTIYFCSTRAGALQLFSMPADGGPATQHSFHSEGGTLECITPDGNTAILRGLRDEPGFRPYRLIQINLRREAPETYVFDEKGNSSMWSPNGSKIIFCREGEQRYRKGYKGPRASSIWSYEPGSKTFTSLIKEQSESRSPMPWPDSKGFYYISERDGCFNLWSREFDGSSEKQLTHFNDDGIMLPALSRDGSTMVFRRGFDLWRHFPKKSGAKPEKLVIWQAEDLPDTTSEVRHITGTVDADFSPSKLEIVFKAEGELWAMDTVLREPNRITQTDGLEDDPAFTPDGKYVYYRFDDGIEANIWRISRKDPNDFWWRTGSFESEQITFGPESKLRFSISPKGTHLAWIAGSGDLTIAGINGENPQVLFKCWDAPTFDWSPDGQWIVFAAQDQNFNRDIYVIPIDGSLEPFNISRHPDFEGSPRWSPDGRKIAFTGRRLNNEMGLFYVDLRLDEAVRSTRTRRQLEAEAIMRDDPYYQQEASSDSEDRADPEVPTAEEPGEEPSDTEVRDEPTPPITGVPKPKKTKRLRIDFDGLSERIVRLNTRGIEPERVIWSDDSDSILFQSKNSSNDTLYSIDARSTAKMEDLSANRGLPIRMEPDGSLLWLVDRCPAVLQKGKLSKYSISTRMVRDRVAHQRLCFRVVWRTLRDRFYDASMNGVNWDKMLDKYEETAANAPDSRTFDRVVAMLLGELNASHLTFLSSEWPEAWENEGAEFQTTRHLGIRFGRKGAGDPLFVEHVIADSPAAHCSPPVQPGDIIVRVNGRRVDGSTPLHRFMNGRMDRRIVLTLRDAGGMEHTHELEPISYEKATELAEAELVVDNRERVEKLSNGKLGYVRIARMFWDEFERFEREIYAAGHGKDGLVIDIRDNGGGMITDHLLTVLCQPRHAVTIPRDGGPGYPQDRKVYASWHKPLIVLCNQNSYSNAEIFAHAIKTLNRGKVVGVTTAGGVISAGKDRILDAGTLRVPFRGWFLPDTGEDMEMNGAEPDITVWATPDQLVAGRDPQLEVGVSTLLKDVASQVHKPFDAKYRSAKQR